MCLGIAMKIIEINGHQARCEAKGIEREVNLFMLEPASVAVGDFVMVHVGYAIQKMNEHDARLKWELTEQMLAFQTQD